MRGLPESLGRSPFTVVLLIVVFCICNCICICICIWIHSESFGSLYFAIKIMDRSFKSLFSLALKCTKVLTAVDVGDESLVQTGVNLMVMSHIHSAIKKENCT